MIEFDFTVSRELRGALVELRGFAPGERVMIRGVEHVVSPPQILVVARIEHQGANRKVNITEAMLREALENAPRWSSLVPIDFDHQSGRGGEAGGEILLDTVRLTAADVDGERRPALEAQIAYLPDVADAVRSGRWKGGSVRLMEGTSKRDGAALGCVLGAWSLTNTPQQDDIEVRADFTATIALDNANFARQLDPATSENDDMPMTAEQCTATCQKCLDACAACVKDGCKDPALLKACAEACAACEAACREMSGESMSEKASPPAEMAAKIAKIVELTATIETATKARKTAEQRVVELTAQVKALSGTATEKSTAMAELSVKLDTVAAEFTAFRAQAEDEATENEIELMVQRLLIAPAEKPLALTLRKLGAKHPAWVEFTALHRAPIRQARMAGSAGEGAARSKGFDEHLLKIATDRKCSIQEAREFAMSTEEGNRLFELSYGGRAAATA